MNWLIGTIGSAVGKKVLMALTGLCFCGFLAVHLAGNLTVYGGSDMFNAYVEHLHALGILITFAEVGLLVLALIHVSTGTILFIQNLRARPERYAVRKNGGGRTIGSATMPYTGFVILVFLVFHLIGFHFTDQAGRTVYEIMTGTFANPLYAALYLAAVIIVALHISHGFWSLFQTLGLNHVKYMPLIMALNWLFAAAVAAGFGLIPVYLFMV